MGAACWGFFLNGGTFALNSYFDNDKDPVILMKEIIAPPRYLHVFGLSMMLAGGVITATINLSLSMLYCICVALSVLYSVPPIHLKRRAGADFLVNVFGYGVATFAGGCLTVGAAIEGGTLIAVTFSAVAMSALFFPLQVRDELDDARRGYRTTSLILGARGALLASIVASAGGVILAVISALVVTPRLLLLVLPFATLCVLAGLWLKRIATTDRRRAPLQMYAVMPLVDAGIVASVP